MKIITTGRKDINNFFEKSDVRTWTAMPHHPFLVFVEDGDALLVKIIDSPKFLLTYPDQTPVMVQWAGKWRSDFFQFQVGDFRQYIKDHPPGKCEVV
jgi:hypothetical protein